MKILTVFAVLITMFMAGCDSQSRHARSADDPCSLKSDEDYDMCRKALKRLEGTDTAPSTTASASAPPSAQPSATTPWAKPNDMPELPVWDPRTPPKVPASTPPGVPGAFLDPSSTGQVYRVVAVCSAGGKGGDPGRNISVYNRLRGLFVEFRADDVQPCNVSGIAATPVEQLNTGLRTALVIPGDGTSHRRALYTSSAPQGTYVYDVDVWRPNAHGFAEHVATCSHEFSVPALKEWQRITITEASLKDRSFCTCDNEELCMGL